MSDTPKRNVSTVSLISLGAGGTIGSGWIYTNSQFFADYGAGGEIFGLALAMCLAIMASLSFAELATLFVRSGGEVVFGCGFW
jgi:amino acid transporter